MTFCYTHSSLFHSVQLQSSERLLQAVEWKQQTDQQPDKCRKQTTLGHLVLNEMSSPNIFYQDKYLCRRVRRNILRSKSDEWLQGNYVFQTKETEKYMTSQMQLAACIGMNNIKPDGTPALRGGSRQRIPPLSKKVSAIYTN